MQRFRALVAAALAARAGGAATLSTEEDRVQGRREVASRSLRAGGAEARKSIHFIYNMGCDEYQLIQAITFDTAWRKAGNKGKLTRILTGCNASATHRAEMRRSPLEGDPDFSVFFLEGDYSAIPGTGKKYPARARPVSVEAWLDAAKPTEPVLAILEPDQLCLEPLSEHPALDEVRPGQMLAQRYSYGDQFWKFDQFNESVPKPEDPEATYSTGPPWLIDVTDVRKMLPNWKRYTDGMAPMEEELYREQFGFQMAAAKAGIVNAPISNKNQRLFKGASLLTYPLMASGTDAPNEAWSVAPNDPKGWKPYVIHYCVSLKYKGWEFQKSLASHGWYSQTFSNTLPTPIKCGAPLLQAPPEPLPLSKEPDIDAQRNMYLIHTLLTQMDTAFVAYRKKYCPGEKPEELGMMRIMQPRDCQVPGHPGPQTRYRVKAASSGSWDEGDEGAVGGSPCAAAAQAAVL